MTVSTMFSTDPATAFACVLMGATSLLLSNGGSETKQKTLRTNDENRVQLARVARGQEHEYLSWNADTKVAHLTLHAGAQGVNGGMNFNGAQRGGHAVILPVGWRVQVTLVNDDNALPHSAIVIAAGDSVPNRVDTPAFPGAATASADEGILVGDSTAFAFTTERAGEFWLFCAVPGHGRAGMYLRLTVSRTARLPRYE
jgi:sulfocyanin